MSADARQARASHLCTAGSDTTTIAKASPNRTGQLTQRR